MLFKPKSPTLPSEKCIKSTLKHNRIRKLHSVTYKCHQAYHNMSTKIIYVLVL